MISADCGLGTTFVVIGKLALVAPAGTVTAPGTVAAAGLSLLSATTNPPEGAAEVSRTVPVDGLPPTTSLGFTVTADSAAVDVAGAGVGAGVVDVEQPESVAGVGVAEPSLTLILQSAGLANPSRPILKFPAPSLVVMAVPLTVIGLLAAAVPSTRSCEPFSSARETRTVAEAA